MKKIIAFICLNLLLTGAFPQPGNNLRTFRVNAPADTVVVDTLSLIPGSWTLTGSRGNPVPDSLYHTDPAKAQLILSGDIPLADYPLVFTYRHYPVLFGKVFQNKDLETWLILNERGAVPFPSGTAGETRNPWDNTYLDRRGSLSRGLLFGNNQSASVTSSLNLQLSGRLNDNLNILAAVSDDNIPVQPDGTTRQMEDFDRVFIQLFNERFSLGVGDLEIAAGESEFLRYSKRVQGISVLLRSPGENTGRKWETVNSGAVSKGKFARNSFTGREGNQGPYRLKGSENETFIVVLAGSERVYFDGKLLTRGQEYDYVFDYNQAELSFTPSRPVTKDSRIVVEFEYSEKSYARFLLASSSTLQTERGRFWLHAVTEQDSRNQPLRQSLSREEKNLLSQAGDDPGLTLVPGYELSPFLPDRALYRKTDTLVGGETYEDILVYSTDSAQTLYQAGFSYLGPGQGNYVQAASAANGRVFRWVAPVDNQPQGDYEPVIRLVTPGKKQLITAGAETRLSGRTLAGFEISLSNEDLNTFSSLDDGNNLGSALKARLEHRFIDRDSGQTQLTASAGYRYLSASFRPMERIRSVEFERDWNLVDASAGDPEHLMDLNLDFRKKEKIFAAYRLESLLLGEPFNGLRQQVSVLAEIPLFAWEFAGSLMNSDYATYTTGFLRHRSALTGKWKNLRMGIREEGEHNLWKEGVAEILMPSSFSWQQWEGFSELVREEEKVTGFSYRNRLDSYPSGNSLAAGTRAEEFRFEFISGNNPRNQLEVGAGYRSLRLLTDSIGSLKDEHTLLGRARYGYNWFRGFIQGNTLLETGTGQEPKMGFTYLEVAPGQGIYAWKDFNGNGLQELDEFEPSRFRDEAGYIRVALPSTDFIPVTTHQFTQVLSLRPAWMVKANEGKTPFISRFSNQLAWQTNRKTTSGSLDAYLNPLDRNIPDSQLVSLNTSLRNTLSFNPSGKAFGIDYQVREQRSTQLLVNGTESRTLSTHSLNFRLKIADPLTWMQELETGSKGFRSQYFTSKNYEIGWVRQKMSLQFQPLLQLSMDAGYRYQEKQDHGSEETAFLHEIMAEIRYHRTGKGKVSFMANFLQIGYTGSPGTFLAWEMLEGFQPGKNLTWELQYQQAITGGIELVLNYGGRKLPGTGSIHTGNIQARAVF